MRKRLLLRISPTERPSVRSYMDWNYMLDFEYTVSSCSNNPWTRNQAQSISKISVDMPPEDLCQKLKSLNLSVYAG